MRRFLSPIAIICVNLRHQRPLSISDVCVCRWSGGYSFIDMSGPEGYGFSPVLVIKRYRFLRSSLGWVCFLEATFSSSFPIVCSLSTFSRALGLFWPGFVGLLLNIGMNNQFFADT